VKIREWLQIGRAQTYPADWLLVIVPFLHGRSDIGQAVALSIIMWFAHLLTFGHNSLLDAVCITEIGKPPPDFLDKHKKHFPLIKGTISIHDAKLVILSGLPLLGIIMALFTLYFASNPALAMTSLCMYWAFGIAYNEGLSKETPLSFIPITVCFSALAAWGWFLGHAQLGTLGLLYILNACFIQLFQIGWEGNLKELPMAGKVERKNWLNVLGARIVRGKFYPGKASLYSFITKFANLTVLWLVFFEVFQSQLENIVANTLRYIWVLALTFAVIYLWIKLTTPRKYIRERELFNMSLMEIFSIYFIIPLLLDWATATLLMVIGVLYFFITNEKLWKVPYPKV